MDDVLDGGAVRLNTERWQEIMAHMMQWAAAQAQRGAWRPGEPLRMYVRMLPDSTLVLCLDLGPPHAPICYRRVLERGRDVDLVH